MPLAENTQVEEIAIRNKNSYSNSYKIVVGIYRPDKKESETKLTSLTAKTVKSKIKILKTKITLEAPAEHCITSKKTDV